MKRRKSKSVINYLGHEGNAQGFTMIEIMVALVILSILVAIAVPVFLNSSNKADKQVARYNLRIAVSCHNGMLFSLLLEGGRPSEEVYEDFAPPEALKSTAAYLENGWVPVDAQYMSYVEPKVSWADVAVVGGDDGGGFAAADLSYVADGSTLADDDTPEGAQFRLYNVYKSGLPLYSGGSELYEAWNLLPGKIGVVENKFYWSGGWQPNTDHEYITFLTLEKAGVAHYITFHLGTILESGAFDWNNGSGNPGDAWADEDPPIADDNPPGDTTPQPPGDQTSPQPPGGDEPPGDQTTPQPPGDETTPQPPGDETTPQPPPDEPQPLAISDFKITPRTLNLTSNGVFTAHCSLPSGYGSGDVIMSTVFCSGAYCTKVNGNTNLKFERQDLLNVQPGDAVTLTVTGYFTDGKQFIGHDTIRVIH